MSNFHGMDGDKNIIARIARRLSLFRMGEIKQGDVIIPVTPEPQLSLSESLELARRCVRYGENTNEIIENILTRLDKYGGCEFNGDVCINPNCRNCASLELKLALRDAITKDMKFEYVESHALKKGRQP